MKPKAKKLIKDIDKFLGDKVKSGELSENAKMYSLILLALREILNKD
jgi:hypothetical protein